MEIVSDYGPLLADASSVLRLSLQYHQSTQYTNFVYQKAVFFYLNKEKQRYVVLYAHKLSLIRTANAAASATTIHFLWSRDVYNRSLSFCRLGQTLVAKAFHQ
jgi:hypothetical protein